MWCIIYYRINAKLINLIKIYKQIVGDFMNITNIDFSEFLELQGMATDIFYQLLIYHDEYSSVILNGMTDSYKNSVSIRIRERLDNLLQGKELPRDYLSIYTLNQSDIPIEQYISRGIHILRNYEDRPVISNHQEFIKANQ